MPRRLGLLPDLADELFEEGVRRYPIATRGSSELVLVVTVADVATDVATVVVAARYAESLAARVSRPARRATTERSIA